MSLYIHPNSPILLPCPPRMIRNCLIACLTYFLRIVYMRRNRVTAPTDLMSELDSDDDDKKLSTQSTVVSSSTAATQGLSRQKTFVSPAASADKTPNPARTAPKTKVSAKRRQVTNAPSSTQSGGNGLFKPLTPAQRKNATSGTY